MAISIYKINKGINKSIEFKGLKAQYIWYLGACVLALLILFVFLYILGLNPFLCMGIIGISGAILVHQIYWLSHRYGEYGMAKKLSYRQVPHSIRLRSRGVFRRTRTPKK